MNQAPETGLRAGVSFPEYAKIEAINASILKKFRKSAAHAYQEMAHPKDPTAAMILGTAFHSAVLEPEKFSNEFACGPNCQKVKKADKEQWREFEEANQGKDILRVAEWDQCIAMQQSVWSHPDANAILSGKGLNECLVVWKDEETGIYCKIRPDRLTTLGDWTVCADLKTQQSTWGALDGSIRGFGKAVAEHNYHVSAAFYIDGLNAIQPADRRFMFIAVEKEAPYCVGVYELDPDSLEQGRREYRRYLRQYAECEASGEWPGYTTGIHDIRIPPWKFDQEGADE